MNRESMFRKVFCAGCVYLDRFERQLVCGLPCNKDCAVQDWKLMARRARRFVRTANKTFTGVSSASEETYSERTGST